MKNNPLTRCETVATQTIHTQFRIIKNVAVMSTGALMLFISYDGLTMLQSTMNSEQGVGVMSQAVLYICYCISSLIFPKYVIKKLGSKLTYAFSMLTYIPYIASNFYPHWSLMIPTSIVIGFGAPLLWGSQDIYLTDVSVLYTELLTAEDSKHAQRGKNNFDKEEEEEENNTSDSHGLSVNCITVDCGGVDIYREKVNMHSESSCQCISYTNIERGCVTYQSDNHDENNQGVTAKTTSSQESASPHPSGHHSLPECQSSCRHKDFLGVGQMTSSSNAKNELYRINSNVKSEVATVNNRTQVLESTTARFFGVHGLMYLSNHLWSNLMSYYVLKGDDYGMVHNSSCNCGADFCNAESASCLHNNMQLPSDATRYLLTGVCVCLALASVVVVFLFLDPVEVEKDEEVSFSLDLAAATFNLAKRTELLLLMPLSLYLGMAQGFFAGEFNKSFVGCAWGSTYQVGPVAICYGTMCAISSLASGWAVRLAGRTAVFTTAALLNVATCTLLLRWTPDPSQPAVFFVAAGMLGCYLGTVLPQLRAFYGVLFKKDEEAAFATHHMWSSLGFCFSFAYTNYLCTSLKIYVLLVISVVGFVGYFVVERRHANNEMK